MKSLHIISTSLILTVCGFAAEPNGFAPTTDQTLNLDQALSIARAHNPELRIARQRVEAATGVAIQARLWSNPELEFYTQDMPVESGGLSRSENYVGLSQTVPFPGKKRLAHQAARSGMRASELDFHNDEIALMRDVTVAFYRVLAADRRWELSAELVRLGEALATSARERVDAGEASAQEELRAEVELEATRTTLDGLEAEREQARQLLAENLGRPDLQNARLVGALADAPSPALLEHLDTQRLLEHPRREAAVANADRAEAELQRERLEPFPDVTLGAAAGRNGDSGEGLMEFRISLPLPLIDRGQGRTREARANLEMARAEIVATDHRLWREAQFAQAALRAATRQVAAYRERILPKAEQALDLTRRGFSEGKFGFLDVLDTQRTAAEARLNYTEKLLELNVAEAELRALLLRQQLDSQTKKPTTKRNEKPKP